MKMETAHAAIRQVFQGKYEIIQSVDENNDITYIIVLNLGSADLSQSGKTLEEVVEATVQQIIGMVPAAQTIQELNGLNEELKTLIPQPEPQDEKEQMMCNVIDIKDCTP